MQAQLKPASAALKAIEFPLYKSIPLTQYVKVNGIPSEFSDMQTFQSAFTCKQRGWVVAVHHKPTQYGIGLYNGSSVIRKGDLMRLGQEGKHFMLFKEPNDLPPCTESTVKYLQNYLFQGRDGKIGIWLPGFSSNHSRGKAMYEVLQVSEDERAMIATCDIQPGQEITYDYKNFGTPPAWIAGFIASKLHSNVVFSGYNDYV